ncbi:MAG: CHASE2 domain-containing protein, partial [Proteobacteria bacterium]|nr:CHASE2 domain-containing protein [Pseudomonadota bacterium]
MNRSVFLRLRRWERPLLSVLASVAITGVLTRFEFRSFEASLYDLLTTTGLHVRPNSDIVLLTVDDSTLKDQVELSPLPVRTHTRLLDRIASGRPRAVGFLINLARSATLEPESERPAMLRSFVEAASRLQASGTPVVLGTPYDVTGELLPPYPISTLPHGLAVVHKDGAEFSGDKVSRRALLSLEGQPSFPIVLAETAHLRSAGTPVRGSFEVPEIRARYFHFRYHGDPAAAYLRIPIQGLLSGYVDPKILTGKIVLVGTALHEEPSDFVMTPYTNEAWASPKLALHAAILDSILTDDGLIRGKGKSEHILR